MSLDSDARDTLQASRREDTPKVPCPSCGSCQSRVKSGESTVDGYRRQRECRDCHERFTTVERFNKIVRHYRNRHI